MFQERGFFPIGVTLNDEDVDICKRKGFEVYHMDQSFLDFEDNRFDFIWNRHCIEHSIFPFYTLFEMKRVLKPGGYLYIEVPAADTAANHQTNPNHYSVLGKSMWIELIKRVGFDFREAFDLDFAVDVGPEKYHSFIVQNPF
jgi:SAM-dependent methyltransferase